MEHMRQQLKNVKRPISSYVIKDFKLYRIVQFILHEGWPLMAILLALTAEIAHFVSSGWQQLFLYNSDSLTLPLLRQSIVHREAFHWVFSSQIFLFPEVILYALSSVLTSSIRASLIMNAYLNMAILYVLFRMVINKLSKQRAVIQRLLSVGIIGLIIIEMYLERQPLDYSIATYYLFNTYYSGVIMSGLAVVLLLLVQLKQMFFSTSKLRQAVPMLVVMGVAALTTLSDPLFLLQVLLPLSGTILLLLLINQLSARRAIALLGPLLAGSVIGYEARFFFRDYIGISVGSYIQYNLIPQTITGFRSAFDTVLHLLSGRLEICVMCLTISGSLIGSLYLIHAATKATRTIGYRSVSHLLVTTFGWLSVALLVPVIILSGGQIRYLIPLAIFPLLGVVPLFEHRLITDIAPRLRIVGFVAIALLVILSCGRIEQVNALLGSSVNGLSCLQAALHNKPANGLGDYWLARDLDVYGSNHEAVLDLNNNLSIYSWLDNLGSYEHKQFSFILVNAAPVDTMAIVPKDVRILGQPTSVTSCVNDGYYVYQYSSGAAGYRKLNAIIQQSLSHELALQRKDDIAASF